MELLIVSAGILGSLFLGSTFESNPDTVLIGIPDAVPRSAATTCTGCVGTAVADPDGNDHQIIEGQAGHADKSCTSPTLVPVITVGPTDEAKCAAAAAETPSGDGDGGSTNPSPKCAATGSSRIEEEVTIMFPANNSCYSTLWIHGPGLSYGPNSNQRAAIVDTFTLTLKVEAACLVGKPNCDQATLSVYTSRDATNPIAQEPIGVAVSSCGIEVGG